MQEIVAAASGDLAESNVPEVEGKPVEAVVATDEPISESALREAWTLLQRAKANYESAQNFCREQSERFEVARKSADTEKADLREARDRVASREEDLVAREAANLKEAEELGRRRADAEAGFLESKRESLTRLDEEVAKAADAAAGFMREVAEKRAAFFEDLKNHDESDRAELDIERRELAIRKRELDWKAEDLEKDVADAAERARATAAGDLERLESRCESLEKRLTEARAERDEYGEALEARSRALEAFGDQSPEQLHGELEQQRSQIRELQEKLAMAPSASLAGEFKELRAREELQGELLREKERALAEQEVKLSQARSSVVALETLRDERRILEANKVLLEAKIEDLEGRIEQLVDGDESRTPFPSCVNMDRDPDCQREPTRLAKTLDLSKVIPRLQQMVAWQSRQANAGRTLYYSQEDLRCFLGGLAMSRLHLLQGISGTGKTSLPLAMADALLAGRKRISVQAGWRDRQDLLGHYNTFDKKYYETEFLQALYEAQTPAYRERPYFIVLDEMNLSHPEQYFADLLSELEEPDPSARHLDLHTSPVQSPPRGLTDGRRLPIPENVWFVGTANHDETTKEFADKTYDRAHMMELPRHKEEFEVSEANPQMPISLGALQGAFDKAVEEHGQRARDGYKFLDEGFTDLLGERFGLSWGNRLERQASLYVPVVLAAGGKLGEAIDHLLATKVLRKLRNRHDIRPEYLQELLTLLGTRASGNKQLGRLRKSERLVSDELKRLGLGDD